VDAQLVDEDAPGGALGWGHSCLTV
jgi:hypothetical protein